MGAFDYLKSRSELREGIKEVEKAKESATSITRAYAVLSQISLVDQIEAIFSQQDSLDSLRQKPEIVNTIKSLGKSLVEVRSKIEEPNRTTYHFIVDALEAYLREDFAAALAQLNQISPKDQSRFTYAYMRGVCLRRTGKIKEAAESFNTAGHLTGGRLRALSMNAEGVSKLYEWRSSQKSDHVKEAIGIFEAIVKLYPDYAPAHLNLAYGFAQLGANYYGKVTDHLMNAVKYSDWTRLVARMREDLARPSESFLQEYVKNYLGVVIPPSDPNWRQNIEAALIAKSQKP